jgi:hypothetical protein
MDVADKAFLGCVLITVGLSLAFVGRPKLEPNFADKTTITQEKLVPSKSTPVTVVELFTSQGCSSCPPADKLFELELSKNNPKLIALSYHVDYWDYLGWKDPFGKAEFSERQRAYAKRFKNNRVYTPQMVVNGSIEFVGSDEKKLTNALRNCKTEGVDVQIEISKVSRLEGKILASYKTTSLPEGARVNLALVRNMASTDVKEGENEGEQLISNNIVLFLNSAEVNNSSGSFAFNMPEGLSEAELSIVAFVQSENLGPILAGTIKRL